MGLPIGMGFRTYRPRRREAMCVLSGDMVTVPTTRTTVHPVDAPCWGGSVVILFCDLQQNENVSTLTINAHATIQSCCIIRSINNTYCEIFKMKARIPLVLYVHDRLQILLLTKRAYHNNSSTQWSLLLARPSRQTKQSGCSDH